MWTREKEPNNIVVNDPKGELLVKNYVAATVRGYTPVQFNLINSMKTDVYNPLHLAYQAAREGDFTKMAMYVENIANVFFPLDGGEDPVWPNAANNAFKRAAYGLIDYYMEEERELRVKAQETGMPDKTLNAKLDALWAHVTLYNAYQLFVQLTAKRRRNPAAVFQQKMKNGEFDEMDETELAQLQETAESQSVLWEDKPDVDLLTLYFNATNALPRNTMRTRVNEADASLRSMGGAEKMLASVYGIAITAMSFFTDPTISTLTSGTPSMNADMGSLSFPRRIGVRLHSDFIKKYNLVGMQAKWMSYEDASFTKPLGKGFEHEDMIQRAGWANYYFKGKYPKDTAYVKLEILNPQTGVLARVFHFKFTKMYQMSLDARRYVKDPVLGDKIIRDGVLEELVPKKQADGTTKYVLGHTTFKEEKIRHPERDAKREMVDIRAITQTAIRYTEKPKMVFLVTPPHLIEVLTNNVDLLSTWSASCMMNIICQV